MLLVEPGSANDDQANAFRLAMKIPRMAKPRNTSIKDSLSPGLTGVNVCMQHSGAVLYHWLFWLAVPEVVRGMNVVNILIDVRFEMYDV